MCDMRDVSLKTRKKLVEAFETFDAELLIRNLISDEYHVNRILNSFDIKLGDKQLFDSNCKQLATYATLNGVSINTSVFGIVMIFDKSVSSSNLMLELEKDTDCMYMRRTLRKSHVEYYETYFKYDDIQVLVDFAKRIVT